MNESYLKTYVSSSIPREFSFLRNCGAAQVGKEHKKLVFIIIWVDKSDYKPERNATTAATTTIIVFLSVARYFRRSVTETKLKTATATSK